MAKSILLVDEGPSFRELLGKILRDRGYEVVVAEDGREALAVLQDLAPDLLLIEAILPWKSGFEVCAAVRRSSRHRRIPILMMCSITRSLGRPDSYWKDRAAADDFISKPFGLVELLQRIEALIGECDPVSSMHSSDQNRSEMPA